MELNKRNYYTSQFIHYSNLKLDSLVKERLFGHWNYIFYDVIKIINGKTLIENKVENLLQILCKGGVPIM